MSGPTIVQSGSTLAVGGSGTTATVNLTGVTPGNAIIALSLKFNATGVAMSNSASNAFGTPDIAETSFIINSGTNYYSVQRIASVTTGGNQSVTATWTSANACKLFVFEVSGISTFDLASAMAVGSGLNAASANISPSANGDLILGLLLSSTSSLTFTQTSGLTQFILNNGSGIGSGALASIVQGTAAAVNSAGTLSTSDPWAALVLAYKAASVTSPTITAVNSGASIAEGATAVPTTGTNFASGMTAAITQPGSVSVAQVFTYVSATNGTFNLSMEPGLGNQLAFTDATYVTDLDVTVSGTSSSPFAITLVPANGQIFQTLASINATSAYRFTATPDLVVGDQVEGSGNSAGTAAIPAGLTFNNDATFTWASGATVVTFWVRAYDSVGKTWGAWAAQSTPTIFSGHGNFATLGAGN